ncbi:MAG: hypothetical protein ABWX96_13165, partial [Propionibacteriaceae bacterium]
MTSLDTDPESTPASKRLVVAGWALHAYTAIGTVLALLAVAAAFEGKPVLVLWILLVALVIDGTDGMLARRLEVKRTIPQFDGARLDDIVDYITYAFVPMVLLWSCGYLPSGGWGGLLAGIPLLASCYQFCRTDAKTEDHYFLGFPSYWNVVAFYVVVLGLSPVVTATLLLVCSFLVFVPVKYLYPSRTKVLRTLNLTLAALWLVLYVVILADVGGLRPVAVVLSLAYIAYYAAASVYLTVAPQVRAARH